MSLFCTFSKSTVDQSWFGVAKVFFSWCDTSLIMNPFKTCHSLLFTFKMFQKSCNQNQVWTTAASWSVHLHVFSTCLYLFFLYCRDFCCSGKVSTLNKCSLDSKNKCLSLTKKTLTQQFPLIFLSYNSKFSKQIIYSNILCCHLKTCNKISCLKYYCFKVVNQIPLFIKMT